MVNKKWSEDICERLSQMNAATAGERIAVAARNSLEENSIHGSRMQHFVTAKACID